MEKIYNEVFVNSDFKWNIEKVTDKIKNRKIMFGIYLIMYSSNENNLLDIVNANELKFTHYMRSTNYIIGIADSKNNALEVVQNIIMTMYKECGNFDIRKYYGYDNFCDV